MKTNWSQSLFGVHIVPEVGIRFQGQHSIMMGVDMLAKFGTNPFQKNNEIIGYYQYRSTKFDAFAGNFPRAKLIGVYSRAFFSDSINQFDPNLSGLLLQYKGQKGYVEFACDWHSMWDQHTREKFLLFSSGRFNHGIFYTGYNANLYHHAGNYTESGVVDNALVHPFVGVDLRKKTPWQQLSLQAGWMQAYQNDRKYVNKGVMPGGVQLELTAQRWNFGVFNTLYLGDNLMPYYVAELPGLDYGPGLYWGEPFYRTEEGIYNRLECYWEPVHNQMMNVRVASVHHYDGTGWGWQQRITLSINLGQKRVIPQKPAQ